MPNTTGQATIELATRIDQNPGREFSTISCSSSVILLPSTLTEASDPTDNCEPSSTSSIPQEQPLATGAPAGLPRS
jgi:hypothetical protein